MHTHSDRLGSLKETLDSQHTFSPPSDASEQIAYSEQIANGIQSLIDLRRSGGDVAEFLNALS